MGPLFVASSVQQYRRRCAAAPLPRPCPRPRRPGRRGRRGQGGERRRDDDTGGATSSRRHLRARERRGGGWARADATAKAREGARAPPEGGRRRSTTTAIAIVGGERRRGDERGDHTGDGHERRRLQEAGQVRRLRQQGGDVHVSVLHCFAVNGGGSERFHAAHVHRGRDAPRKIKFVTHSRPARMSSHPSPPYPRIAMMYVITAR